MIVRLDGRSLVFNNAAPVVGGWVLSDCGTHRMRVIVVNNRMWEPAIDYGDGTTSRAPIGGLPSIFNVETGRAVAGPAPAALPVLFQLAPQEGGVADAHVITRLWLQHHVRFGLQKVYNSNSKVLGTHEFLDVQGSRFYHKAVCTNKAEFQRMFGVGPIPELDGRSCASVLTAFYGWKTRLSTTSVGEFIATFPIAAPVPAPSRAVVRAVAPRAKRDSLELWRPSGQLPPRQRQRLSVDIINAERADEDGELEELPRWFPPAPASDPVQPLPPPLVKPVLSAMAQDALKHAILNTKQGPIDYMYDVTCNHFTEVLQIGGAVLGGPPCPNAIAAIVNTVKEAYTKASALFHIQNFRVVLEALGTIQSWFLECWRHCFMCKCLISLLLFRGPCRWHHEEPLVGQRGERFAAGKV
jgi:hypothetical protein